MTKVVVGGCTIHRGDCLDVLRGMAEASVDAVVTDPPYGLSDHKPAEVVACLAAWLAGEEFRPKAKGGFMNRSWDAWVPGPEVWREVLRVLKPGGHACIFAGTRSMDLMSMALRLAGFEMRDSIGSMSDGGGAPLLAWITGQGFPKSLDVGKAIDKARNGGLDEVLCVTGWIAARCAALGLKAGDLDRAAGTAGMSSHWVSQKSQPAIPTLEQWVKIEPLLGPAPEWMVPLLMPARRPGEAWFDREVLGEGADQPVNGWAPNGLDKADRFTPKITAPATDAAKRWQGWGTSIKPSWEPVIIAQKPLSAEGEWATIAEYLFQLWGRLWSMLPASAVEDCLWSSPVGSNVDMSAFARWNAGQGSSIRDGLCVRMGTSRFVSATISSLSTVSSWNATLAASWEAESTSTTVTTTRPTIELRTLRFSLSKITPESIVLAHESGAWSSADACPAGRYLSATVAMLNATRECSALEPVIEAWRPSSLAGTDRIRPDLTPIVLCRRPLAEPTVAAQVLATGTGALNIDATRVPGQWSTWRRNDGSIAEGGSMAFSPGTAHARNPEHAAGRWPSNLVHSGDETVRAAFAAFGVKSSHDGANHGGLRGRRPTSTVPMVNSAQDSLPPGRGDTGTAARFFPALGFTQDELRFHYSAKANKRDRAGSKHPTIKPQSLLRWLARLITPPGGTILDPFAGSGSLGQAALAEGFNSILIERELEYYEDCVRRMEACRLPTDLFTETAA